MGRRKRKQQGYKRVKRVPKIFTCPECGEKSVKVENLRKSVIATVKCGHCGLNKEVLVNSISEPVDAFGDFIDVFYADQELNRLEKRIEKLKIDNELADLALCYAILSDICKAKAVLLMEDEDHIDMDGVNDWKLKSEKYKRMEKDTLLRLDEQDLTRDVKTDEDSLFDEHDESDMRREKKIEDIFEDSGFLEF